MRGLIIIFLLSALPSFGQNEFMTWVEAGVDGKIIKPLKWSAEVNGRFGAAGAETIFPQVGLEYKVAKWFRPSVDYRLIIDKNKYGNYHTSNRININLSFKHEIKRLGYGLRLRYQYAFSRISQDAYNADFDQAIRIRPEFEYDIKGSKITPEVSGEFFYDPSYGKLSPGFSKMRLIGGIKINLKGPHTVGIKYQLDKKFRDYSANLRHVLGLSYKLSL